MLEQAEKDDIRGLGVYRIAIYPTHCFKTWNRHYGPTHSSILYFKEVEKISRGTLRPECYSFCDISGTWLLCVPRPCTPAWFALQHYIDSYSLRWQMLKVKAKGANGTFPNCV